MPISVKLDEIRKNISDIVQRVRPVRMPRHLRLLPSIEFGIDIVLHMSNFFMKLAYLVSDVPDTIIHMGHRNQLVDLIFQRENFPFEFKNLNHSDPILSQVSISSPPASRLESSTGSYPWIIFDQ